MTPESFRILTAGNAHPSFLLTLEGRIVAANAAAAKALGERSDRLEGRALQDLVMSSAPDFEDALRAWGSAGVATRRALRFRSNGMGPHSGDGFLVTTPDRTPTQRILLHCVPVEPSAASVADRAGASPRDDHGDARPAATLPPSVSSSPKDPRAPRVIGKMEAMGDLAAGIAHDFNNLLTVMKVEVELSLEHGGLPTTVRESLASTHQAVRQAEALVDGLLAFSRRQLVQVAELDLRHLVDQTLVHVSAEVGERNAELIVEQASHPLPAFVDRPQMETVLRALLRNAYEALPSGRGTIHVRTRQEAIGPAFVRANEGSSEGEYAALEVADDGAGIPPDVLVRLFEPFFTTKGRGAGRGLGLAQAFGIIKALGGYLRVDSAVGVGSTFTVYLPLAITGSM